MRRKISAVLAAAVLFAVCGSARADEGAAAKAVVDKAIKALGGSGKLDMSHAVTWKAKGKIVLGGNESEFTSKMTVKGLDHFRQEFEGDFGGNPVKGVTVLAGDKGWRKFGDEAHEMKADALANQKRVVYLQVVAATVMPLREKGFKITSAADEKVGDKPAVAVKATGPDDKEFTLYFDKESGLPIKQVARVTGFRNEEYTQETTFANYKEFGGMKWATKIETKRDGEKFIDQELDDFKVGGKVDATTFAEPQ